MRTLTSRSALIWYAVAAVVVAVAVVLIMRPSSTATPTAAPTAAPTVTTPKISSPLAAGTRVCGQPVLDSPYSYDGAAGPYRSGTPGLPTYGKPGSDFPKDTAGVVLAAGRHDYMSYQLNPDTVYYLLPGTHIGGFQADRNDAFVGGRAGGKTTVLSGDYSQRNSAINSNFSDGNQTGVTVEYLTIEKYSSSASSAAINPDSNTGWTIQYNTITLNAPGAGVILGADNVLKSNCLTLNGQYGFQAEATNSWGTDTLTGGPYNITVDGNEISYNDTCDFEGLLDNPAIGWQKHNPVPPRYRNPHCGEVFPDGDQGGFKLWHTNGVTIKNNHIHHNWGPGAWVDSGNANTTFTGNTITDNDGEAIVEEVSYNFSITNNYLARNDIVDGLANNGFPSPAIYISESGSDTQFGGVPACPEASCSGQGSYRTKSVISHNILVDNGGTIFLWQNSNRHCSDGYDGLCTWLKGGPAGPFTIRACKANWGSASVNTTTYVGNRTGSPPHDWWDGCMWKTENVSITHNIFVFNPAHVMHCNRAEWPYCGAGGMFSEYSSPPRNAPTWAVPTAITFFQHNVWSDNVYYGPSTFYAWNQGNADNPVSWAAWTGKVSDGDMCGSAGERESGGCTGPFGQDAGSTYK